MPSQEWIKKHGVNPFAICNSKHLKGAKKERCIKDIERKTSMKGAKKSLGG